MLTKVPLVGVVVIGRNEGERLGRCLQSVIPKASQVVYVDSGSTDGSCELAASMGVEVKRLDPRWPFTAARARNEGAARLLELSSDFRYLQFVDGDCEVVVGWLDTAVAFLEQHGSVGVVCGRRRERYPDASVFNKLCDLEWDTPLGEARACGGDAMVRVSAFAKVDGFRADLIAGEEPELCVRLRRVGWKVWRLDADMTIHDAAMTHFSQWWRRSTRAGYAFAEGASLHGAPPERHWVEESRRAWIWGLILPFTAIGASFVDARCLLLLLAYPAQVVRIAISGGRSAQDNWLQAFFWVLGRFPEGIGQLKFLLDRFLGRQIALIEYK